MRASPAWPSAMELAVQWKTITPGLVSESASAARVMSSASSLSGRDHCPVMRRRVVCTPTPAGA